MTIVVEVVAAIVFFALIMASIALHEIGHLIPAKAFGVKVTQYFVGFGRTLWSRRRGGTEYGIKLWPLGGYVRMVGMYPPGRERRDTWVTRLADEAREAEWSDITEDDVANTRLFYQKKTWQKLIVMAGGPTMNILLAFLIFLGLNLGVGQQRPGLTMDYVQPCVDATATVCTPTPAAAAGLQQGDTVVSFNGTTITSWEQFSTLIQQNGAGTVALTVERPGAGRVALTPVPGAVRDTADPNDASATVSTGFLGVRPEYDTVRVGPVQTAQEMGTMTWQSLKALAAFPVTTVKTVINMATGQPRDESGPISILGASRAAGEIATTDTLTPTSRFAIYLSLLGSVNLFVAILNLVPLLPFDGGHIAGAIWEWLRRTAARLARRPDPGHVDTARLLPVAYVVGGFLLLAGVALIVADIVSPVKLF